MSKKKVKKYKKKSPFSKVLNRTKKKKKANGRASRIRRMY